RVTEQGHPASQNCISCHLPKRRPADAIHVMVTDHLIEKRPIASADPVVEKHDGNTPPYRGTVRLYYPSTLENADEGELYLAVAQVRDEANLEEGLNHLEAALARYTGSHAEFRFELGEGYRHAGKLDRALAAYQKAATEMPNDWRSLYRIGTTLTAL